MVTDQLDNELARGKELGEELVKHLHRLKAAELTIPVVDHAGRRYAVVVRPWLPADDIAAGKLID